MVASILNACALPSAQRSRVLLRLGNRSEEGVKARYGISSPITHPSNVGGRENKIPKRRDTSTGTP